MLILEPTRWMFIQFPEAPEGSNQYEYYKTKPFVSLFFWLFPQYFDSDAKMKIIDNVLRLILPCLSYRQLYNLMVQLALSDTYLIRMLVKIACAPPTLRGSRITSPSFSHREDPRGIGSSAHAQTAAFWTARGRLETPHLQRHHPSIDSSSCAASTAEAGNVQCKSPRTDSCHSDFQH